MATWAANPVNGWWFADERNFGVYRLAHAVCRDCLCDFILLQTGQLPCDGGTVVQDLIEPSLGRGIADPSVKFHYRVPDNLPRSGGLQDTFS